MTESEQQIIDKAQANLDYLLRQLSGFKVPAYKSTIKFMESILNHNGFHNVQVELDVTNMYTPTVKQATLQPHILGEK